MTATSIELWGPLLVAFVVAAAVTPAAIKIAPKIGAMDIPKDERRMHKKPMPRFGGIAIYLGIMAALAVFALKDKGITSVMTGCTLIYMLGLIDDLKDLKPLVRTDSMRYGGVYHGSQDRVHHELLRSGQYGVR